MNSATRAAGFGAEVKRRVMLGTFALSSGYYDAYYGQAQRVRTIIVRALRRAYERVDVLLGADDTDRPRSSSAPRPATRSRCTCPTCSPSRRTSQGIRR